MFPAATAFAVFGTGCSTGGIVIGSVAGRDGAAAGGVSIAIGAAGGTRGPDAATSPLGELVSVRVSMGRAVRSRSETTGRSGSRSRLEGRTPLVAAADGGGVDGGAAIATGVGSIGDGAGTAASVACDA